MPVHIVRVRAEGVRQLHGHTVQHPQHEHLDEGEQAGPHWVCNPLGCDKRDDEPVQDQTSVARLRILRREGRRRQAEGVVVLDHAVAQLLEDPGEQWRGRRQDFVLRVFHDEVLHPAEEQLNLATAMENSVKTLVVQVLWGDKLVLVDQVVEQADAQLAPGLELGEGHGVKHADQADEDLLEVADLGLEPFRVHLVDSGAAFPPPGVRMVAAEDHEEDQKESESAPHDGLCQDPALLPEH
mmetsp:Transcript_113082/g.325051  ORF Transcript_113082/g.325051 Transcript_113082/m.325051 type:complete len:240 (+) Transcript_113082:1129-1848(+)